MVGFIVIVAGIFTGKVSKISGFGSSGRFSPVLALIAMRPVGILLELLTVKKGILYRFTAFVLRKTDFSDDIKVFFLYKLVSFVMMLLAVVSIRFTNVSVARSAIITGSTSSFFYNSILSTSHTNGLSLYNKVIRKVPPGLLSGLSFEKKQELVKEALVPLVKDKNDYEITLMAADLVKAFDRIAKLKVMNLGSCVLIILSYWFPELFLIIRRVLQGSRYKKEVIKLENVFELLGGIKSFRTIDILNEMARASPVYEGHLDSCRNLFKTEKQAALDMLKNSVRNGKFARLVDIIRIYALTDKALALQILERNRLEREEQLIITAEEDVDLLDMVAFLSVVPILLELADLIIRPMLEVVNETFMFIK